MRRPLATRRAVLPLLLLLLAPLGAGCRKAASPEQSAVARYDAWRKQGGRPGDPTFDALVAELEALAPGAPEYAQARARLEELRAPPPVADAGPRRALRPACAPLEDELALADGDRRDELERAVAECRADAGLPPLPDAGLPAPAPAPDTGEPEPPEQHVPVPGSEPTRPLPSSAADAGPR